MDTAALEDLREAIVLRQEAAIVAAKIAFAELTLTVAPGAIPAFAAWLRSDPNCRFTTLIDITAVDWPARDKRFDVVYHFLSMHLNQRIRVRAAGAAHTVPGRVVALPERGRGVPDAAGGHVQTPELLEDLCGGALVKDRGRPDDPDVLTCTHRHASFIVLAGVEVESLADGTVLP